ncbi:MAG: flavodoxin domain-containing protein [Bacteroidales bacterium]
MKKRDFLKTGLLSLGALMLPKKAEALEFYPMPSDKKWAVLFGTWCGTSRDAGIWISEGMGGIANVFDVRENPDLSAYDHIVVGSSIRNNEVHPLLRGYLEKNRPALEGRVNGLFAVCGNMMQPLDEEQYTAFIDYQLSILSGAYDVPAKVFLGRITWGLMEPDVRERMQQIPGMVEYDNLKRSDCLAFGRKILEAAV